MRQKEDGFTTYMVMLLMAVIFVTWGGLIGQVHQQLQSVQDEALLTQCQYGAERGISWYLSRVQQQGQPWSPKQIVTRIDPENNQLEWRMTSYVEAEPNTYELRIACLHKIYGLSVTRLVSYRMSEVDGKRHIQVTNVKRLE
ncbi:MAG: hypothetical protein SOY70_02740 [Veillonellaceae bacterium]|nr:hypothetical protein [Veillonellaceae bacterium]